MDSESGLSSAGVCLLSGKSEDVYRTCLSGIIGLCEDKNLKLKPEIIHLDFELTVMNVT